MKPLRSIFFLFYRWRGHPKNILWCTFWRDAELGSGYLFHLFSDFGKEPIGKGLGPLEMLQGTLLNHYRILFLNLNWKRSRYPRISRCDSDPFKEKANASEVLSAYGLPTVGGGLPNLEGAKQF